MGIAHLWSTKKFKTLCCPGFENVWAKFDTNATYFSMKTYVCSFELLCNSIWNYENICDKSYFIVIYLTPTRISLIHTDTFSAEAWSEQLRKAKQTGSNIIQKYEQHLKAHQVG